jgi:hypothetical protein
MACGQSTGGHVFKREVGGNSLGASPPCTPLPCAIVRDRAAIVVDRVPILAPPIPTFSVYHPPTVYIR